MALVRVNSESVIVGAGRVVGELVAVNILLKVFLGAKSLILISWVSIE